jgi:NADH-quinone oxidoreductase subunit D
MELYERVCGARMHAAFYRPNEVNLKALSRGLLEDALDFGRNCLITLNEMHNILTYSKIWKQRLVNIGSYSLDTCLGYGLTGVMARSAGARRDLRLDRLDTYANYYHLHFRTYLGQNGDSYDRFLMRMNEMAESINIISQLVLRLTNKVSGRASLGPLGLVDYLCPGESSSRASKDSYSSMEQLIGHFKHWGEGATIKSNWTYRALEAPKGEFGVGLVSDGTNKPFKCKVRSSAYHHLQVLPALAKGHFIADLSALIGTVDIVFGEIDR